MIKHIILLRLRDSIENRSIEDIIQGFRDLKNDVPGIMSFSFGKNISKIEVHQDYNFGVSMVFVDSEYFDLYHQHPKHAVLLEKIQDSITDPNGMLVFDYPLEMAS